jgi:hypothetical protein
MLPWRWRRTLVVFGAIVALTLSLVASSAYGYFTTHGSGTGSASIGTLGVAVSTPYSAAVGGYKGPCTSASVGCTSITLPTVEPVGSRFDTTPVPITITNTGSIPITESEIRLTASTNGTAGSYLRDEMNLCISSGDVTTTVVANGPLSYGLVHDPSVTLTGPTLAPGATDEYAVDFYAGQDSTTCNKTASDDPDTAAAWGPYVTPPSLTNAAEGGAVDVTLTWSYTN